MKRHVRNAGKVEASVAFCRECRERWDTSVKRTNGAKTAALRHQRETGHIVAVQEFRNVVYGLVGAAS